MKNPLNQRESDVERACVKFAHGLGWLFRKQQGQGNRGKTDRFFLKDGITVFVEFKRPGEEPTQKQYNEINKMREYGFEAEWFDTIKKFKDWLQDLNDNRMSSVAQSIVDRVQ